MTTLDFSTLNTQTAHSFAQQRNLIKKVCQGNAIPCPSCQQTLRLQPPQDGVAIICCTKKCTHIELELD